jgi:hypothetical protein
MSYCENDWGRSGKSAAAAAAAADDDDDDDDGDDAICGVSLMLC